MKKGIAVIWAVIITAVIALGAGGGASYYYLGTQQEKDTATENDLKTDSNSSEVAEVEEGGASQDSDTEVAEKVDTGDYKTLKFTSGETLKYPADWEVNKSNYIYSGSESYAINEGSKGNSGNYYLYDMKEWLKGPGPDEGYVMQKEDRAKAYQTMLEIYADKKLSAKSRMDLNDYSLEFFSYRSDGRADVKYIQSLDGKSRGFTMINTGGQDAGLALNYIASLYNKDSDKLIQISLPISHDFSEIKTLALRYGDYNMDSNELIRIDSEAHQDFVDMMMAERSELSFGNFLNTIDASITSVKF
ncbi:MAG: hypothetical protein BWY19_00732 [bacterium ADurb.Bin212]|nr:MAG: hypothetical protein BWY19_00732 [bacterium ADurb.Bin212]